MASQTIKIATAVLLAIILILLVGSWYVGNFVKGCRVVRESYTVEECLSECKPVTKYRAVVSCD